MVAAAALELEREIAKVSFVCFFLSFSFFFSPFLRLFCLLGLWLMSSNASLFHSAIRCRKQFRVLRNLMLSTSLL